MTKQFTVSALPLKVALETALIFAESDDEHGLPALLAVHFTPLPGMVAVGASDRFIASRETLKAEGEVFQFSMPRDITGDVIALVPPFDSDFPAREPGMVTFAAEDDGRVSARVVGPKATTTLTFTPVEQVAAGGVSKVVDVLAGLFQKADDGSAGDVLTGLHLGPAFMARVCRAFGDRDGEGPVQVVGGGERQPLLLRQRDGLMAAIMPVAVEQPSKTKAAA